MANLIVSVITSVALMATLCYAVPNLVFKNENGATNEAKFGKSRFVTVPTAFASNNLSSDLTEVDGITKDVLSNFKYFGENGENEKMTFENIQV